MSPLECLVKGGTQIGAMRIEQSRADSGGSHGAAEGRKLVFARSRRATGAELSTKQAIVGTVSPPRRQGAAAWQLRARLQPSSPGKVSASGAGASASSL